MALKKGSEEFLEDLCEVGVLDGAGAQAANNVLSFALCTKSVELALIACKASVLTKENVPQAIQKLAVQTMLGKVEMKSLAATIRKPAKNAEKQQLADDILQLGLKFESIELVLVLVSNTPAPAILTSGLVDILLQFAFHHASCDLAIAVCRITGALGRVGMPMVTKVLTFALEHNSVELAALASQAAEFLTEELMQATASLSLSASSVELADSVCQREEFCASSATVVSKILQVGVGCQSVELVLAVITKPCACIQSDTLISLLQFAVKHRSCRLAHSILMSNAGMFANADHQILIAVLEMAIDESSNALIARLSEEGVLQRSDDNLKEKTLHLAAFTGDLQLADQCVSSGVLHAADQWGKPTAIDVAKQRGHSRLAEKLRKALDSHKLLVIGQRRANTVLVRVAGPPGAGKSTLVKSLITSRARGIIRRENQPDEDDMNFKTRTRGIKVKSYTDSNGAEWRILDLGGQEDFTAANQLFIGEGQIPIINLITISSLKDYQKMEEEVLNWTAFFASRKHSQSEKLAPELHRQPVIIAATRFAPSRISHGFSDGERSESGTTS